MADSRVMKLENKTIVLTGGSSGVGLEILRQIGARNKIINLSRSRPDATALAGDVSFVHIEADLADATSVASAIELTRAKCPDGLDGLINCAALQYTPRLTDPAFDPAMIAQEIAINLTSPIELIAGLLPCLQQRPESFSLNVNSGVSIVPKRESAVYCATKAGLDNFSRGLRAQLAGSRVAVLQAFLPLADTKMTQGRGRGKLPPGEAARLIIAGIESRTTDNDIGKVKLLRAINRLSPRLARRIMQRNEP